MSNGCTPILGGHTGTGGGVPTSGDVVWAPGKSPLAENEFNTWQEAYDAAQLRKPCTLFCTNENGNLNVPAGVFDMWEIHLSGVGSGNAPINFPNETRLEKVFQISFCALVSLHATNSPLTYFPSHFPYTVIEATSVDFYRPFGFAPVVLVQGGVGIQLTSNGWGSQATATNTFRLENGAQMTHRLGPHWFQSIVAANYPWESDGTGGISLVVDPMRQVFFPPTAGFVFVAVDYGHATNMEYLSGNPGNWVGSTPNTLNEAIERIANFVGPVP